MAEQLDNIAVTELEFISVNAESGITIGSAFWFQNRGRNTIELVESSTKPEIVNGKGISITKLSGTYSDPQIAAGSLEVWVRCLSGTTHIHVEAK